MKQIAKRDLIVSKEIYSKNDALKLFTSLDEDYKVEIISEIDDNDEISFISRVNLLIFVGVTHVPSLANLNILNFYQVLGLIGEVTKK